MSSTIRLIAWAEPDQVSLVRQAVEVEAIDLAAVGSPDAAAGTRLSETLAAEHTATLREAILRDDIDLLWIVSPREIGGDERRLLREARARTISTEPLPGSAAEVLTDAREAQTADFVPLMRHSPGYRAAREVFGHFGERCAMSIFLGSGPGQGTLFARLFDAMDLAEALGGSVQQVHAALWRPLGGVPDTLRGLSGSLTITLRFSDNRCASLTASDCAGGWLRRIVLLGAGGCLCIDDGGFEWMSPDGRLIDAHRERRTISPGELVAGQIRQMLSGIDAADPPPDTARLLALCEAARLSARTCGPETPAKVMEMLKRR